MSSNAMADGVMEAKTTLGLHSVKKSHLARLSFSNHQSDSGCGLQMRQHALCCDDAASQCSGSDQCCDEVLQQHGLGPKCHQVHYPITCRLDAETIRQAGHWSPDAFASHYVKTVPLKTMLCAAGVEDPGSDEARHLYYVPRLKFQDHVTEAMLDAKSCWLPRLRAMVSKVRPAAWRQCLLQKQTARQCEHSTSQSEWLSAMQLGELGLLAANPSVASCYAFMATTTKHLILAGLEALAQNPHNVYFQDGFWKSADFAALRLRYLTELQVRHAPKETCGMHGATQCHFATVSLYCAGP